MKLGSLKSKSLDGDLIVISKNLKTAVKADFIAKSLREAVEDSPNTFPKLKQLYDDLNSGKIKNSFPLKMSDLHSPMPRSFAWLDGSAYIQHIKLVRKARGAELPATLETIPLMYQGGSDTYLAPTEPIPFLNADYGLDFEAEVGVVTDFVKMGSKASEVKNKILLVMIINDITLRGLVPAELSTGFGFYHSKPSSAFAPIALTPDELGENWRDGRVHLPLITHLNGSLFGRPNAGEMHFSFYQLIEHASKTRDLSAGTILGSGTVSNNDPTVGSSCLVEKRTIEQIEKGKIETPYMKPGDHVKIEMLDPNGVTLFGEINQKVVQH